MLPGGLPTFGYVTLGMGTTLCRSCAPTSDLCDTCGRDRTDESSAIRGADASQLSFGGEVHRAGHERPGLTRDCTRSQGCSFLRWRPVEVPEFLDRVDDVPVVSQRQVPMITTAQKTVEDRPSQCLDRVDGMPVSMQRSAPMI